MGCDYGSRVFDIYFNHMEGRRARRAISLHRDSGSVETAHRAGRFRGIVEPQVAATFFSMGGQHRAIRCGADGARPALKC